MESDKSDWKFPQDVLLILALCASPIIGVIFLWYFFHEIANVRRGDLALFWIAVGIATFGLFLLSIARSSLYRKGKLLTFGSKSLPERYKIVSRIAYYLIIASVVIMLLLLAIFSHA